MNLSKLGRMRSKIVIVAAFSLAVSLAHAHGDRKYEKKAFDAASAEQKPFGIAGDPAKASKTIKLAMSDNMRFTPNRITVKQGETIQFVIANKGKMLHEFVIGTPEELKEHFELMKKFPNMEHEEAHMTHVKAGKTDKLTWTFNRPGEFAFACLIPGHFEAGMSGKITVVKR